MLVDMRKIVVGMILAGICILSGCGGTPPVQGQPSSLAASGRVQTEQKDGAAGSSPAEKSWTVGEITALFTSANADAPADLTIIDSIVIPDLAYDRVGAVLYRNNEKQTSNVAFLDAEGYCQTVGIYAKACADSRFAYCGDGTVAFDLETEEGAVRRYQVSISIEGGNVNFTVSDSPEE